MKAFIQHRDNKGGKMVLQSLVRFMDLKGSVVFTSKTNLNKPIDDKKRITEESLSFYQRRINLTRISEIENFIVNSILDEKDGIILATLFPSSMILAINEEENSIRVEGDDVCEISFDKNVFIVDGQHRMLAMLRVYDKIDRNSQLSGEDKSYVKQYIENYKFNCTVLLNYDLWEQGQVFINVNFKQKPVNKSLYYEIFGSEYRENKSDWKRNKIYLAHCLAKVLNEHPESPYYKKIKMLGTGVGYISQAFVVETLLPHFSLNGIWSIDTNKENLMPSDYTYFATELVSFFHVIFRMFPSYWPEEGATKGTLICKTTGFGALSKLMGSLRDSDDDVLIALLKESNSHNELCKGYMDYVEAKLKPLLNKAKSLFGKDSIFQNNSGKAAVSKYYKQMLSILQKPNNRVSDEIKDLKEEKVDSIYEAILDYLWNNELDDLSCLSHHYEVEDVSDFQIDAYKPTEHGFKVTCRFFTNVSLFLDNEDENGFMMSFPTKVNASFDSNNELNNESIDVDVDTSKYFE
ncbi:MAG: DGQHR domain-containing protein [Erysipelotrichaceae bacterium]|nr:DGQHR domain-containing protein [Erysipelotrichaceae bacterium]